MIDGTTEYAVTVHTVDGRSLGDVFPADQISVSWSRELNEVSRCTIDLDSASPIVGPVMPWHHWVTVWGRVAPVWSGPVFKVTIGDDRATIEARDVGAFLSRTRVPVTRQWRSREPESVAVDLWRSMLALHRVAADPLVLPSSGGDVFDLSVDSDVETLAQTTDDLVKLGLRWAVVAGRPVLGVQPHDPVAVLHDADFLTATEVVRDGSRAANDVRVQGQNYAHTYTADMSGLRLQSIVSIDDLFGVSNIKRAARQYAREVAAIREQIVVPSSASLHPDAGVTVDDLVPGARFHIMSRGLAEMMLLTQVNVVSSAGVHDVQVTFESIEEPVELQRLEGGQ